MGEYMTTELYLQFKGEKLNLNPDTTQSHQNTVNTSVERM
jgi:hypothetical protein